MSNLNYMPEIMPGILHQIYFGKSLLEDFQKLGITLDSKMFLSGNILLESCPRRDRTHCYVWLDDPDGKKYFPPEDLDDHFPLPHLELAAKLYANIDDSSLRLGLTAHLFLDYHFAINCLAKRFKAKQGIITIKTPAKQLPETFSMTVDDFYSRRGLLGTWDLHNDHYIENEILSWAWLKENIPCPLPEVPGKPELNQLRNRYNKWLQFLMDKSARDSRSIEQELFTFDEMMVVLATAKKSFLENDLYLQLSGLSRADLA